MPDLSVVVVAHNMARELPRTLSTLRPDRQVDGDQLDYELIVVDNGSATSLLPSLDALDDANCEASFLRIDEAPPSPARAANVGIAAARGDLIGLIIDGARMASPGLLSTALAAARTAPRPVVASLAFHLGAAVQMEAVRSGYDQRAEDQLLDSVDWRADGYQLFQISVLAASSSRGWFGPLGESSALFLRRESWDLLGGLDEAFALPGGGLVNHDLLRRACSLPDATLIHLLGEGTFHQFHGGAATSSPEAWNDLQTDYEDLRGSPYTPLDRDRRYYGSVPPSALPHLGASLDWAVTHPGRLGRGPTAPS